MLNIEVGDFILLNNTHKIEITREQDKEPYIGTDNRDGSDITFYEKDIECIKKHNLKCVGGDKENYWYFYSGAGYNASPESIANWALFELRNTDFLNMSIEEIMSKHIYWGTDSPTYKAFYNGDTYVLFLNLNHLPEDMKEDAENQIN